MDLVEISASDTAKAVAPNWSRTRIQNSWFFGRTVVAQRCHPSARQVGPRAIRGPVRR